MKTAHHSSRKASSHTIIRGKVQSDVSELVKVMQKVKTDTEEAKLNETTMSDNNGGRIKYRDKRKHKGRKRSSH